MTAAELHHSASCVQTGKTSVRHNTVFRIQIKSEWKEIIQATRCIDMVMSITVGA